MVRRAVVIYLVFMTATGPNLCCCTSLHLFANAEQPPVSQVATSEPDATSEVPSCCRSAGTVAVSSLKSDDGLAKPNENAPKPRPDGCPCCKQSKAPASVSALAKDTTAYLQSSIDACTSPDLPLFACLPTTPTPHRSPHISPQFLSADELLYVHHQLRC